MNCKSLEPPPWLSTESTSRKTLLWKEGCSPSWSKNPPSSNPTGEEVTICHVIDTCEYCADTVDALQDLIIDKIHPDFKSKIDLTEGQEAFYDITAKSLRVLVSGLETRLENAYKQMYAKSWSTCDTVGEESSYVRSMHDAILPFVQEVQARLPASLFKNFCDKFAHAFTNSYYNALIRLKRISELGTQQLLLDVYNFKTLLLKLPIVRKQQDKQKSHAAIPPAMYTKIITKEFQRMEILLKLVGTPADQLGDMFKAYWPSGTGADLQTVMTLKGMKRNEQQALIEKTGLDTSTGTGATQVVTENLQLLSEKSSTVVDKVNSDLSQMRQKVVDFRMSFRQES